MANTTDDTPPAAISPATVKKPGPCTLVIFGANGDLTKRLVTPALYNLALTGLLPDNFAILGIDHNGKDDVEWRGHLTEAMQSFVGGTGEFEPAKIDAKAWSWLTDRMFYLVGDFEDSNTYTSIKDKLAEIETSNGTAGNVIFYLAIADRFFGIVVDQLGKAKLVDTEEGEQNAWRRVVIEKPFGHDLQTSRDLNKRILQSLNEDQVYRIDHFLGKETVQNIMTFRFANGMFEPLWNRDHIDHVQITVAETVGVEGRGYFYEATGALRDMVPNHVFQLLCMTAMEPPTSFAADAIRSKKVDVFASIKSVQPGDAVRGQYDSGSVLGKAVRAYRTEPNVNPYSDVETYAALRLEIDNWRWAGVPFYIRTGKYMTRRTTEIAIRFKSAPTSLFEDTDAKSMHPNWLVIQIQPDEGISMQFDVKQPGPVVDLKSVKMNFSYSDWFPPQQNVGYETLIYDVMLGDQTLFQRADQVEEGWRIVQPVIDAWAKQKPDDFPNYIAGTAGPAAADALLAKDGGRSWRPVAIDPGPKSLVPGKAS
ncbi:glucose-6-phosphate dehydrogenase [Lichenihabitans sp. PAMC28606]|uniref:glucose-6-phosphate dehydrogenase n=1 Tax=Lichenihabitans sp. PAMC28606 TaxID=2880932 RepID=UPI001D0AF58F|nr:glucose-6-phosphate dehydrogenase [Lichenihabitans sp. PAMC28606]UDL95760.1 glucose-6-phosphate dehydrogenase [Lichenihabitans sp. PAMC28606]